MSDDYQIRKDIDRITDVLDSWEAELKKELGEDLANLNNLISYFNNTHYDTSQTYRKDEVYNQKEIDTLLNTINSRLDSLDERVTALEEAMQNANQ